MAGGPEDHFTDSVSRMCWSKATNGRMWRPLIPTPVTAFSGELVEQLKEIARLRAESALTESDLEAVEARWSRHDGLGP
jgi:hypothetical protein